MTVAYQGDVNTASTFGCFNKVIFRWKGSLYRLLLKELLAYVGIYFGIHILYQQVLVLRSEPPDRDGWTKWREGFESIQRYFHESMSPTPVFTILIFYVVIVMVRWWDQYLSLPAPDNTAILSCAFNRSSDYLSERLLKRTVIRYLNLSLCLALRTVSFTVKRRFPDLVHLVDSGLLREDELKVVSGLAERQNSCKQIWFLPLGWAADLAHRQLDGSGSGNTCPQTVNTLMKEICNFRDKLGRVTSHDSVPLPLVFTQLTVFAVYSYLVLGLVGYQPSPSSGFSPLVSLLIQFVLLVGLLRAAEVIINPFGEDEDDFELNTIIDRHIQASYLMIDACSCPSLLPDRHFDDPLPIHLPYTVGAERFRGWEYEGSAERALYIEDRDKEYGSSLYTMGHVGRLSRVPTSPRKSSIDGWPAHPGSGIYEPIYATHYESLRSINRTGAGGFRWSKAKPKKKAGRKALGPAAQLKMKMKRLNKIKENKQIHRAREEKEKEVQSNTETKNDSKRDDVEKQQGLDTIPEVSSTSSSVSTLTTRSTPLDNYFKVKGLDESSSPTNILNIFKENEKGEVGSKIKASKYVGNCDEKTEINPKGSADYVTVYKKKYFSKKNK